MADLTPAEQQFFATGELPPELAPTPASPSPVDLAALSNQAPAPASTAAPAAATSPAPASMPAADHVDVAEVLRRSLQESMNRQAQLEAQLAAQQKPVPQEDVGPDPNVDPLGAMMHQINAVNKSVAALQAQLNQQSTQQTQLSQLQQFQQQVHALRDQFMKSTPDFLDAYNHIRSIRTQDLRAFGLPDDQIQQALLQDEVQLSQQAIRFGKNPAQVIYDMAKTHGYTPQTAAAPASPPATRLQNIQQTPSSMPPGTPAPADITLDGLKNASDADLNKMVMNDEIWSKIAGKDQYPL